jgi:hypothetical protein
MHKRLVAIAVAALFIPLLGADTPHANVLPLLAISAIAALVLLVAAVILGGRAGDDHAFNTRALLVDTDRMPAGRAVDGSPSGTYRRN